MKQEDIESIREALEKKVQGYVFINHSDYDRLLIRIENSCISNWCIAFDNISHQMFDGLTIELIIEHCIASYIIYFTSIFLKEGSDKNTFSFCTNFSAPCIYRR